MAEKKFTGREMGQAFMWPTLLNVPGEKKPNDPLYQERPVNFADIPNALDYLRYAQAGVGDRDPRLTPPKVQVRMGDYAEQKGDTIYLNPDELMMAEQPYVPKTSTLLDSEPYPNVWSRHGSGTLLHELVHYLNMNADGVQNQRPQAEAFAQQQMQRLGNYKPFFGVEGSNAHANSMEELANRVAMPYIDAREIGRAFDYKERQKPSPKVGYTPDWIKYKSHA
jgi:hypothetical protein